VDFLLRTVFVEATRAQIFKVRAPDGRHPGIPPR